MNRIELCVEAHDLLAAQLQACFLAAQEVGLAPLSLTLAHNIDSNLFACQVVTEDNRYYIQPQFAGDTSITGEFDIAIRYGVKPANCEGDDSKVAHLYIGVAGSDKYLDICRFADGKTVKVAQKQGIDKADYLRHYCWFLTAIAQGFPVEDALVIARLALKHIDVSRETWPSDPLSFQELSTLEPQMNGLFPDIQREEMKLYPVVSSLAWVETLLQRGIKTLQLRIKEGSEKDIELAIIKAILLGRQFKAQLFINDYWQLAIKHGAYGVHLGQEDLIDADLQAINQAGLRLGISTHGYYELLRATQYKPSYIALGHIFATTTKQMPSKPQGVTKLELYQQCVGSCYPTVAIGGIDLDNAQQVWQTGVSSLAVVRAITLADDIQLAIDSFYQVMTPERVEPQLVLSE